MLRDEIRKDILSATGNLHLEAGIKAIDEIDVTRTNDSGFGDFTTNVALKVSHKVKPFGKAQGKQSPMEFAKVLAQSLQKQPYFKKLEVKEPRFVHRLGFCLRDGFLPNR